MKKVTWLGLCLFLVAVMLLASCSTSATTTTQTSATASTTTMPPGGETVLTVIEGSKVNNFSLMDLRALPSVTGYGGYVSQSGTITGPFSYQGVTLTNLLNTVGGISEGDNVVFTSSDNYTQTFSYDQITNGNFNYYDITGSPVTPQTMPTLTLIYSENGTFLDNARGPVELGMLSPQNILTDGSLWAKMVTTITVTSDTSGLNSSSTSSTNGLSLSLSLGSTTYQPGQEVSIAVDEKNTLPTINDVPVADNLPSELTEATGFTNEPSPFPFGLAVFHGNYTLSNYSTVTPLIIYDPSKVYIGTQVVGPTSYSFQPLNDTAVLSGGDYNSSNGLKMQYEINVNGYWPNNASTTSTNFEPGVYTVVAGDEWGALVLVHFTVSQ
jgi:hypothetical protein